MRESLCGAAYGAILTLIPGLVTAQQFVEQSVARLSPSTLTEYSNQVAIADVDGDGDLDIMFANGAGFGSAQAPQRIRLYINDGAGFFTEESTTRLGAATAIARDIEFGDVDGDGDLDFAVAQDFARPALLFLNDGVGVFTNVSGTHLPSINMGSPHASFGDIDNDGDLDLAFADGVSSRFGTGRSRLFLNDGTGHYTDVTLAQTPNALVTQPMDINFVDLDGDRDLDIVTASRSNSTKLLINNGAGVFTDGTPGNWPGDGSTYSFDFGDFDADGDQDVLGVNSLSSREGLYVNNGAGVFVEMSASLIPGANNPNADDNDSKFFDIDDDGDLDFIIARLGGAERINRNDGGVYILTAGVIQSVTSSALDVEVGDLDGDGDLDIVTAVGESGAFNNKLYINSGPADTHAPRIVHVDELGNTSDTTGPYVVRAILRDDMTADDNFEAQELRLQGMISPLGGPILLLDVPLKWMGHDLYRAEIPGQSTGTTVSYSVHATDFAGNTAIGETFMFSVGSPGDLNGDGVVNGSDLAALLANWGGSGPGDLDNSGSINGVDLAALLANWG